MTLALGNDLLFGVLQGLRVVERPRSGGPLRKVGTPTPASSSSPADASPSPRVARSAAPTAGERLQLSPEALRLADSTGDPTVRPTSQTPTADAEPAPARLPAGGLLA